jgi:AraC-like DNA-binding protein
MQHLLANHTAEHTADDSWRARLFSDILSGARLRSSVYFRPEFGAPWAVSIADHGTVFHIVATGTCWLRAKSLDQPLFLTAGDFVVATRGEAHVLSDEPARPAVNFFELIKRNGFGRNGAFRLGEEPTTRFLCGGLQFENGANCPLLTVLPPFLHVRAMEPGGPPWLRLTVEHIRAELDGGDPGAAEVVTRLADILFIQAVRAYFEDHADTTQDGWLAAARDREIGQALALIHANPDEPWTVETLARRVATSRSAFADRFTELVGEPPLRYLTQLRINAAARRLRSSDDKMSAVAANAGYDSLAAFSRAFKRQVGMTPGEYRDSKEHMDWKSLGCGDIPTR